MEKYLGNKTGLLPLIQQFLKVRVPRVTSVSDLFAGTTNVSRAFRREGIRVATGDLNRFSYVLARAYLTNASWPTLEGIEGPYETGVMESLRFTAEKHLQASAKLEHRRAATPLARALAILQFASEKNVKPGIFHTYFCAEGARSDFVSARGGSGRRNYFSEANALALDGALQTLRQWRLDQVISEQELMMLLASVIEEVVIVANVSGTFHDFSRTRLWPNALQKFTLRMPPAVLSNADAEVVNADAVSAASSIGPHDVCYIDPPYNFRQYGAYYHLLNFIAAYPFLGELDAYAHDLSFVRGQNMADDHTSSFCYKDSFISSLADVIARVSAQHVVLSYYGGRNHWNHWSATDKPTDRGLKEVSALFKDKQIFDECEIVPALSVRQNYQSRVGERKQLVNEYLLLGSRTKIPSAGSEPLPALPANERLNIATHFSHFTTTANSVTNKKTASRVVSTVA